MTRGRHIDRDRLEATAFSGLILILTVLVRLLAELVGGHDDAQDARKPLIFKATESNPVASLRQ
jgi:hypothetical protein